MIKQAWNVDGTKNVLGIEDYSKINAVDYIGIIFYK